VTLRYENGKPVAVDAVVLSTQHDPDITQAQLKEAVMEEIVKPVLPAEWLHKDTLYHINPTGQFIIGGPVGDCGLTGRKRGLIEMLDLLRPIYGPTAAYGHFGREEPNFTWEKTDKANLLKQAL